jgi:signal transduction histidine kinase
MKKWLIIWLTILLIPGTAYTQRYLDSLHTELSQVKTDTSRIILWYLIAQCYEFRQTDSNDYYVKKIEEWSNKLDYTFGKYLARRSLFFRMNFKPDYAQALHIALENLKIAESTTDGRRLYYLARAHQSIALVEGEMGNVPQRIIELNKMQGLIEASNYISNDFWEYYSTKGEVMLLSNPDSGIFFLRKGHLMAPESSTTRMYMSLATARLADGYVKFGNDSMARIYYQQGIDQAEYCGNLYILSRLYWNLSQYFQKKNPDSSLYFGRLSVDLCKKYGYGDYASKASRIVANIFKRRSLTDSALKYTQISLDASDSIFNLGKLSEFTNQISSYEQKQREDEQAKERFQFKVRLYSSIAAVLCLLILAIILYRNNRNKQRANILLGEQKKEIEQTLANLKMAQSQLIQSEKMASLGELTAGIAHEIQNPLNFVNNFSEVNAELIKEMKDEMKKGNLKEAESLANNLLDNEDKISHHGKRADAIVKGMLEHSRANAGKKEPTDINTLAEEYLRLAYHGFRAKNKDLAAGQAGFNVAIKQEFDPEIGNINIIRQDIGRVLLNLFNNAFYAVAEKSEKSPGVFQPAVSVSTKFIGDKESRSRSVEIKVKDNGFGVPGKIRDKIFQPFYTTKPAGQGTGLGLSLSYDIIKAHGGEISLLSEDGLGAEFIIHLPKNFS